MESKNYLAGPKLGDFINSLMVCKRNYELNGVKANIFLSELGCNFTNGLDFTYKEVLPVLERQEWFEKLNIYTNQPIDINLISFRNSHHLYVNNWINIFLNGILNENEIPKEYKWIDIKEKDFSLSKTLLINRSLSFPLSDSSSDMYKKLIENYEYDVQFICFDITQYENFKFKTQVKLLKVDSLLDFFIKINSCNIFLGNQSSPTTIASSMNIPRIIELANTNDANHYKTDDIYYSKFKCF